MALSLKALAATVTLVGSGIALPVCLVRANKGSILTEQKSTVNSTPSSTNEANQISNPDQKNRVSDSTSQDTKTTEKVECSISNLSSDLEGFLNSQDKEKESYSLVSCKNTIVTGDYPSLLDKDWMGLFPKSALEEAFTTKTEEKFEMTVETEQEEGLRSSIAIAFKNPKKDSFIKGRWGDILDTIFGKRAVIVSIEGVSHKNKEIYLLFPVKN